MVQSNFSFGKNQILEKENVPDKIHPGKKPTEISPPGENRQNLRFLFFSQKKGLRMWVDHVPEYYEASSTRNLLKSCLK